MKRRYGFLIGCVITFHSGLLGTDESLLQSFINLLFGQEKVHEQTPQQTYIKQKVDYMLATHDQSPAVQRDIAALVDRIVQSINGYHVEATYQYPIAETTNQLIQGAVLQYIADKTKEFTQEEVRHIRQSPPINPTHLKPVNCAAVVEENSRRVLTQAQETLNANTRYGSLREFVGESLQAKVRYDVEIKFGVYQTEATYQSPAAGAPQPRPARPREIYEIYPDFQQLERNKDFHQRREHGKLHREDECPICYESFALLTKRVNLFCGHVVCPTCLFSMLFVTQHLYCPLCRERINVQEFSASYLRPHVNFEQLQQNHAA